MISIDATFDNTPSFYFEGEKVCVKLKVTVEEPAEVNWITTTFVGVSKCIRQNPKEPSSQSTIWHVVLPTKSEITRYHFNHPILVHKINSEKSNRLSVGPHEYNVSYQLPNRLPSSLESDEAYVRYYVYIVAEVNSEIIKQTEFFTVCSKVDLNNHLGNSVPAVIWLYQNLRPALCMPGDFLCGLFRCGNIRAVLHVDKTGYVPGERIKVYAQVNNLSNRTIDWVKASLVQTVKYNCSKVIKRKRVVTDVLRGSVMPYESQVWRTEEIPIPALPPTTTDLINVVYKLYLQIKPSWQEKTFTTKKKLIIGSIPVREVEKSEKGQGDVNGEIISMDLGANFEPCCFGARDVEEEGIVTSFTPVYPVFEECD